MHDVLASLHPIFMIPFVLAMWFAGSAAVLVLFTVMNFPGISEYGTRTLLFLIGFVVAVIGSIVQIILVIRRRRALAMARNQAAG